jgi:hypothetical protein
MHYNYYNDDPSSSINLNNIPKTCSQCHEAIVGGPGIIGSAIVARLKGHGKVNPGVDYRSDQCLACHYEVANHGPKERVKAECAKCHEPKKGALTLGPIHKSDVFTKAPSRVAVKVFYGFGLAMVAFAFMSLAGKKYQKPKDSEEEPLSH